MRLSCKQCYTVVVFLSILFFLKCIFTLTLLNILNGARKVVQIHIIVKFILIPVQKINFILNVLFNYCSHNQWCPSLLSIGGDNLQFYPNFALFSTLGGMNLDHDFVQVWKFSEDQKNCKWNTFFPKFR